MAERKNKGRSAEARDPDRPTTVNEETGETEKVGLGPRHNQPSAENKAIIETREEEGRDQGEDPPAISDAIFHPEEVEREAGDDNS